MDVQLAKKDWKKGTQWQNNSGNSSGSSSINRRQAYRGNQWSNQDKRGTVVPALFPNFSGPFVMLCFHFFQNKTLTNLVSLSSSLTRRRERRTMQWSNDDNAMQRRGHGIVKKIDDQIKAQSFLLSRPSCATSCFTFLVCCQDKNCNTLLGEEYEKNMKIGDNL